MDEHVPVSTSPVALQQQHVQKRRGSDDSDKHKREYALITQIRATDVVAGLRRMPAGFYVAVEIDGKTMKTSNKPVLVGEDIVWDEEIFLPSEESSVISFRIYASCELGPMLGNGELVRQFNITVGEMVDFNEQVWHIRFPIPKDNEVFPSCSSLRITTERRICDVNEFISRLEPPESDEMSQLGEITHAGHHALLRYRQLEDQSDLDEAIAHFERVRDVCPPDHPNRSAALSNLVTTKSIHSQASDPYPDLVVPMTLYEDALQFRPRGDTDHCATALDLDFALMAGFQIRGNGADRTGVKDLSSSVLELSQVDIYVSRAAGPALEMADARSDIQTVETGIPESGEFDEEELIQRLRAVLPQMSYWDPRRPLILGGLGALLDGRFERHGDLGDIHEAVSMLEDAVRVTPDSHPVKPTLLAGLGSSLMTRFERLGDLADINKSISIVKRAVRLTPDGQPEKPGRLTNLGNSLLSRFERLGDLADISKSISMHQEGVRLTPDDHPDKPDWLNNLGTSLCRRFARLGDLTDINMSISIIEAAVHLTPDYHPHKPALLNNLGISLFRRFDRLGDLSDINKSVLMQEEAVCLTSDDHPDKPKWLSSLGNSLSSRFDRLGDLTDINKSISRREAAVHLTPDDHPDKPTLLNNLGSSLSRRFDRLGDLTDINQSISMLEEAVHLTPEGHPGKPKWSNNLGSSLLSRFERLGDLADLSKSISMREEAVRLTQDGHPDKPALLNAVGISLLRHFERLGDLADINKSMLMFEEAVRLTPEGHPDKPASLNNFGNSLLSGFEWLGDLADINKSISMFEEAMCLTPEGHPDKPSRLSSLGNLLSRRFEQLGDLADINKSISMFEEAVHLTPEGHPDKPALLNNLGNSLLSCFERLGDLADINKSMLMFEEAVRLTPEGHPDQPSWLSNLGISFNAHFNHSSDLSSLLAATLHFSLAARSTGPTPVRFRASRSWASSARLQHNPQALLDAYATSINLLPELAWVGLPLAERHHLLITATDVARGAAAAAIEAGFHEMAVEWLEQGRSVVWSQFLQLRTPVDDLRVEYPALAHQFQHISRELEQASSRQSSTSHWLASNLGPDTLSLEKETQRHHALAISRDKLLADIRSLPGFDRFLLPKTIQQLATSAHSGPVVFLNACTERCDALIVMQDLGNVLHVPLPDISYPRVEFLQKLLRLLLQQSRLIISRDDISALLSSEENLESQDLLNTLLMRDCDRAAKVKPQRIEGYTPDDLFRVILAFLWESVVHPVLDALGFSTPPSGDEKKTRIFWCPTGPFAFLPIHAAGLHDSTSPGSKLSDFVISSYIPTLNALQVASSSQEDACNASESSKIHLVSVPQPPTDGLTRLTSVPQEINHIKTLSASSPFVTFQDSQGTIEDVLEKMESKSNWVHFACHGVQDPVNPLDSGVCLADGRRLKLSDIIRLSRPRGGLAFLSACQTAQGDEKLSEESVHLAAGMLLAGYSGVIATMWSIMDRDAPKVAKDVYEHLFRDGKVPDSTEAAEALDHAVQNLRDSGASFFSWVPFIHVGI